jgi:glycerol-1-phosphate dehydrogenase [NAD(P)+]
MTDLLDRLLSGRLSDPDDSGVLRVPILSIVIDRNLAQSASELIAPLEFGSHTAVISDPDTRNAMGQSVVSSLEKHFRVSEIVLSKLPHPDMETVDRIRAKVAADPSVSGVISVGSGTICDLGKYVSHLLDLPFAIFGTAPSMNAYTSVNAAITENGHKKSLVTTAPRGVFLDIDVLAKAPRRLISSGFGDSICRSTAQTDWLAAHLILGTPYREAPFMLLREEEDMLVKKAGGLIEGDVAAIEMLARTLVFSGLGMTICGGSYPASQGEHLLSHFIDMLGDPNWPQNYHGEQISVTTLTCASLQEILYRNDAPAIKRSAVTEQDVIAEFGEEIGKSCWDSFKHKMLDEDAVAEANARLAANWPDIRQQLHQVMRPLHEIRASLKAVKAPTSPLEIGVPAEFYNRAIRKSHLIRDRFTCLDFAASAGILEQVVEQVDQ